MVFYAFFSECMLYAYAWAAQIVTANNDNEYCSYINASALNFTPNLDKQIITPTILIQVWSEHFILRNRGRQFQELFKCCFISKEEIINRQSFNVQSSVIVHSVIQSVTQTIIGKSSSQTTTNRVTLVFIIAFIKLYGALWC